MLLLVIGIIVWIALAATGLRYAGYGSTLHSSDRMGASTVLLIVGLPLFVAGLLLIINPLLTAT